MLTKIRSSSLCFNAARGFVGGATNNVVVAVHAGEFRFNAARGFVGGATKKKLSGEHVALAFQCRTRLCGWCNIHIEFCCFEWWRFQCRTRLCGWCNIEGSDAHRFRPLVSMPHAALWVVQQTAVTRLCQMLKCFNAARGFVGGATASLAALVPLWGKSPFGKSPEI